MANRARGYLRRPLSGPPSIPASSAARLLFCLPLAVVALSELARWPSALGFTLGFPVSPFGAVPLAAIAAVALHAAARRPSLAGAIFGTLFALATFVCLDLDVPRRRGLVLALAAAGTIEASRAWVEWCAARSARLGVLAATLLCAAAAAGAVARFAVDREPLRGSIQPSSDGPRPTPTGGARSIVLITMDTTRLVDLGCYGQTRPATPHIDRFAKASTRFTRAYSTSPFTAPSVASMVTGQLPMDHGSIASSPMLDPDAVTLAEHCYSKGYETAGFLDNPWLGADFGLTRGYEYLSRRTDHDEIKRWLDAREGRRFLLHVHLFHPHGPYDLRHGELEALGGPSVPEGPRGIGNTIAARRIRDGEVPGRSGLSPEEIQWAHDIYLSEVRAMDRWIGGLLALLDERGLLDASVVALTADHGEEFGERGGMHHSHTLFNELVHVPLLLRAPGLLQGVRGEAVSLGGLGPGLAVLAGLEPMAEADDSAPWIREPSALGAPPDLPAISIRCRLAGRHFLRATTDRWSLHVRLIPGREPLELRLFDLNVDPGESSDVHGRFQDVAKELLGAPNVATALAKLRAVPLVPAEGSERPLTPRTASDLRALGYSK